ncbi:MAG: GNAT family N-acetyltransferase [Betaproteobacteria bacterium]|nr:MAG: GNAT family N-acetyltransferase [Betaproteobacteria bacterium]
MSIDLRRLEEISQNASRPERGIMIDGWSVGLSPSKAKRSRCVNPHYQSVRSFEQNLRSAKAAYAHAKLPCVFRLTPWVADPSIDAALAAHGYQRFDATCVMAINLSQLRPNIGDAMLANISPEPDLIQAAQHVATLRGDSDIERDALAQRWSHSATPCLSTIAKSNSGAVIAHALVIIDDGYAGVFDVVTHADERGRGIGRALLQHALQQASALGAHTAYLQVMPSNPARRLYERMGFADVYEYWYRALPEDIQHPH